MNFDINTIIKWIKSKALLGCLMIPLGAISFLIGVKLIPIVFKLVLAVLGVFTDWRGLLMLSLWTCVAVWLSFSGRPLPVAIRSELDRMGPQQGLVRRAIIVGGYLLTVLMCAIMRMVTSGDHPMLAVGSALALFGAAGWITWRAYRQKAQQMVVLWLVVGALAGMGIYIFYAGWVLVGD
jgi:hypothetical protein